MTSLFCGGIRRMSGGTYVQKHKIHVTNSYSFWKLIINRIVLIAFPVCFSLIVSSHHCVIIHLMFVEGTNSKFVIMSFLLNVSSIFLWDVLGCINVIAVQHLLELFTLSRHLRLEFTWMLGCDDHFIRFSKCCSSGPITHAWLFTTSLNLSSIHDALSFPWQSW